MSKLLTFSLLLAFIFGFSCKDRARGSGGNTVGTQITGPYNLNAPQKFNMPDELVEISGIVFRNLDPSVVYTEQDEAGKVYQIKLGEQKTTNYQICQAW